MEDAEMIVNVEGPENVKIMLALVRMGVRSELQKIDVWFKKVKVFMGLEDVHRMMSVEGIESAVSILDVLGKVVVN